MSNNENDPFMSAFEPLATNVNHKSIKRRSSILKSVDINYGEVNRNEERRGSRRVSWAHTFQYKELLADGTAVIMCHELNSNVSEDVYASVLQIEDKSVDNNVNQSTEQKSDECEENKINASEFINRLKANTSLNKSFSENSNKRHQSNEDLTNGQMCSKAKKAKKNSKGLTNYLVKHYNTEDKKDYETVFNTSFNKYGREVVPRTQRPDFTQLFTDENNAMTLTQIIELSQESNDRTDRMAITLNESTAAMNISEELVETNKTRYFTDESIAMTDCTVTMAMSECTEGMRISNVENTTTEWTDCVEPNKENTLYFTNANITGIESSEECLNSDKTQCFTDENIEIQTNERTEQSVDSNKTKHFSDKSITSEELNKSDKSGLTPKCIETNAESSEQNKTYCFTNEIMETSNSNDSFNSEQTDDSGMHTIHDTTIMMDSLSDDTSVETSVDQTDNGLHISVEEMRRISCKQSITGNIELPNITFSKSPNHKFSNSAVTNEIEMGLEDSQLTISPLVNPLKPLSDILEETNFTQEMSITAGIDATVNTTTAIEVRSELIEQTPTQELPRNTSEVINVESIEKLSNPLNITENFEPKARKETAVEMSPSNISECDSIPKTTVQSLTSRIPKPSISTRIPQPMIRKSILSSIQMPNNTFSKIKNLEQNKRVSAPKLSMGWLAQSTHQNNNITVHNTTQNNHDLTEQGVRQAMTTTIQMSNIFKRPERKSIHCSQTITAVLPNECVSPTVSVKKSNEDIAIQTNRPLMNSTVVRPNRFSLTARLELSKSVVKDTFGLGMTERLKQKRDEFEAKRRQSIVNNAFTPSASNSVNISEQKSVLHSTVNKDVTQLSTDLFNSKSNLEAIEDMEVEEKSESGTDPEVQSLDSDSNSKSKSEMNSNSKSFSETNSESNTEKTSDSETDSTNKNSNSNLKSNESSISSSDKSQTSSLNLNSTSPLSISVVHSSDNYLVSSPATIDPTLDFTFHRSDTSDSFDPFVHTNQSFHTTRSFYESTSPLQLSFMVREDTLCILADELERQIEDIVIPAEDQKLSISSTEELDDMFTPLKKLDAKQNGFTYEVLNEDKALISYLWGTFALEIRFGNVITTNYTVRDIISINMKSLIGAEEPLHMRQNNLILKFNDSHKPLITIAHDLIISSFENERQLIISKHKTSASLDQLIADISVRVLSAKRLLSELRIISSTDICRLYPKQNDRYRLVVEILGLRKPIHLIIPINAKSYPDEVIHPMIRIRDEDKHLYCVKQFSAAFLRIECRKFDYIRRLIWATKAFIRAKKRIIYEKQKNLKQKQAIESARLVESFN